MRGHFPVSMRVLLPCSLLAVAFQVIAQQPSSENVQEVKVILGVLEDHPGNFSGDADFRVVRAVFTKLGNEWRPFPTDCSNMECLKLLPRSYPQEVTWTVAFDGRSLGRVATRTPRAFDSYADVGIERMTTNKPVPTVGKKSKEYSGWLGEPVYRPLAAVSQPNVKDPDSWKPAHLLSEQIKAVRKEFRSKFAKVSNCRDPNENILKPWRYSDENIKVKSAYSSNRGWSLVQLGLDGWGCDGPQDDDSPFIGQWYTYEPSGKVRFLGTGMWLVDAGDYDGDGKSEVLFAVFGYDLGGYRLFYRDFSQNAEFLFSYH
ncbi:MAG: hypothetical protein ABR898_09815 [Terracidiphilus sp.]